MSRASKADRRPRPPRARGPAPDSRLGTAAVLVLAAWALLLAFAPPASNRFWAVNGLRSLAPGPLVALLLAAALAPLAAVSRLHRRWEWWGIALGVAVVTAFALPERIHFLGDSQLRLRALWAAGAGVSDMGRIHANPLDMVVDFELPLWIHRLGVPLMGSISIVGFVLALAYLGGLWRLAGRLGAAPEQRVALALALALTGALEAFAGYAEVGGLVAVAAVWWWAELLAPLRGPGQVWRLTGAFAVLLLVHRAGLAMVVPQLWRAIGPPAEGDRPEGRRALLLLSGTALVLAVLVAIPGGLARQLLRDGRDLLRSVSSGQIRPGDSANALVLVAPLAVLAPALAGRKALAAWIRTPAFQWVVAASLPLAAAAVFVFPLMDIGLGAQRDWDLNILLGVALTVGAGSLLARLPAGRLRVGLAAALPLLAVGALGWVAVNADVPAATARAVALARDPAALPAAQLATLHAYFGQRAMDERRGGEGARHYETAFRLGGNPRLALLAAEAWLVEGDVASARRMLALARSRGPLDPELETGADRIEAAIAASPADSDAGGASR